MLDQGRYIDRTVVSTFSAPGEVTLCPPDPDRVMVVIAYFVIAATTMTVRVKTGAASPVMFRVTSGTPLVLTWKDHGPLLQYEITGEGGLFPSDCVTYTLEYR